MILTKDDIVKIATGVKTRPHKLQEYPLKTDEVRRCSITLFICIMAITIIFSGWVGDSPVPEYGEGLCEDPGEQLAIYVDEMKVFTKHQLSFELLEIAQEKELSLYNQADVKSKEWNCREPYTGRCQWPIPYESECQATSITEPEQCIRNHEWWKLFKPKLCLPARTIRIDPCQGRAAQPDAPRRQHMDDIVVATSDDDPTVRVSNAVVDMVRELVKRANLASSLYCVWVAVMIFIGPAYHLYSYSLKTRVQDLFIMNKMVFMALVVSTWYIVDHFEQLLVSPRFIKMAELAAKDPCFMDTAFITELADTYVKVCNEIDDNEYARENVHSIINYYRGIEKTWLDSGRGHQYQVYTYIAPTWTPGCGNNTAEEVLDSLKVPDTKSNGLFYLVNSGYIASIFIQPLVVNFAWYTAEMIMPLSAYDGRVVADPAHEVMSWPNRFDKFIRIQYLMKMVVNVACLIFVWINMYFPEKLPQFGTPDGIPLD